MTRNKMFPDQFTCDRRLIWTKSRAQAKFRKEPWLMSFEEFCALWNTEDLWHKRGRQSQDLVMTRIDPEKPWQTDNCEIITRYEQFLRTSQRRMEGYKDEW